jgi:intracellular sulfur oxidation DsrE/DsrF family protein
MPNTSQITLRNTSRHTRRQSALLAVAALLLAVAPLGAQPTTGPVIMSGGAVFDVPNPTFATPTDIDYRVAFEINLSAAEAPAGGKAMANDQLNTLARFLNMHARAGVPPARVRLAAVVHGTAGKDLLDDETYRARYGTSNPSAPLIKELLAAGVQIILCGQTSMGRDVPRDHLIPGVQLALSAMTALSALHSEGYRLNPW